MVFTIVRHGISTTILNHECFPRWLAYENLLFELLFVFFTKFGVQNMTRAEHIIFETSLGWRKLCFLTSPNPFSRNQCDPFGIPQFLMSST